MIRYNKIENQVRKREIVLLKGLPCAYGKCSFCNYILDNTTDEEEIYRINNEVLDNITGEFGVLEVINSASVFELPKSSLEMIKKIAIKKKIHTIYFEAYFAYVNRLNEIRSFFEGINIRFIIGIETFDNKYRIKTLKKNFYLTDRIFEKIKQEYYTALLLICTKGQTKEQILNDIELGTKNFSLTTISIFIENGTEIKRDEKLVKWFLNDVYPNIKDRTDIEILVDNKDFGVYVQ
ncbi:radical SAM protein [Oceanivirga salmonicida]|uniref:radical SAM protein n=2 Tax=Oceanivirga salmonicida TaxID=1769291 RepID=UPI0008296BFC|nr:radical SAM protein [Oceanivirga salmonicida]